MSQENVEIVRRGFEAYSRRDVDGFLSHLDSAFELHSAIVGGAEGRVYQAHDDDNATATPHDNHPGANLDDRGHLHARLLPLSHARVRL
jgi:hypothetical protein